MDSKINLKEQLNELLHEIIFLNKEIMDRKMPMNFVKLCEQDITILAMIANQDNLTAKEISEKLQLPKTTVVTAVKRLVDRGYIYQIQNVEDKRENLLKLSEKGKMIHTEHLEYEDTILEFLVSKWSEEQQEQLYQLIKNRRRQI
jgi:DNA-binding MarR family transcriptional regulator